ncbi:hypothetical protein KUTeg_015215 [Tegillarca granosa]|uniref:Transporter n=1 Tax=Tegillarca granosa TaxID=220873 RepID=A0ABQ9EPG4_TEGGR|nr:hypothetical protein KUTeg_015215 [Tegillarca granosa]
MKRKPEWNNSREFLLSVIGYSVGIGNVWRFPYTCYDSGGGAFLIIYLIMWALCGIPLMYLELAVGQHTRKGPIGALCQLCPLFKGAGIGGVLWIAICGTLCLIPVVPVSGAGVGCVVWIAICRTLYMVLLVWPFYYLFNSFISVFPWSTCGNLWNTPDCKDSLRQPFNTSTNGHGDANITTWNVTMVINTTQESMVTYPASEYFRNHVLQLTSGIENLGHVRWDYALILVLSWSLIYLSIFKGPKLTGKIVYVTVLFPYVVLFIFIVRGFTLPGSYTGMLFFLKPNWSSLLKPKVYTLHGDVWISAAVTNFFSLGIGGGANITLARTELAFVGGLYYFSVMDYYVNFVSGFSLAFVQIISFAWIYGGRRLSRDITKMTGSPPNSMGGICLQR